MARPRSKLPAPADIRALADAEGRLAVRVSPGVRTDSRELADGLLHARVRAIPEDGKATAAVLDLLAKAIGVAPSRIRPVRGATSREKLVQLPDQWRP